MELAANCKTNGMPQDEAYHLLNEKIGETIHSSVNVKQIRIILLNMWYRPEDWFLERCTEVAKGLPSTERIAIHWALLLERYPVFYDLCNVIGELFDYRDDITLAQIRNRIFEKWGARNTLENCLSKNIQMFRELKALNTVKPVGTYTRNVMPISEIYIMQLLCIAVITASGKEYMRWEEVIQHPALFPFQIINMNQADMSACEKLVLERMGDDVVIRVR